MKQLFARGSQSESIEKAMEQVRNPQEMCVKISQMIEEFIDIIKGKLDNPHLSNSVLYHQVCRDAESRKYRKSMTLVNYLSLKYAMVRGPENYP